MSKRRVVVTGLGMLSPLGASVDTSWEGLTAGRSGIAPLLPSMRTAIPCDLVARSLNLICHRIFQQKKLGGWMVYSVGASSGHSSHSSFRS